MPPRSRVVNAHWTCPRCNAPNDAPKVPQTPDTVIGHCDFCDLRTEVFVPLEQEGPYRADGLMNDQVAGELDAPWWDFVCPLCQTHNKRTPPPYQLGQPRNYDRIVPCLGCHRNIRVTGVN